MRMLDYLGVASRNLVRQKSRTFLTIIAITIGSLSLILMTSLILGVHQSLIDQFKQFGAFNLVTVVKDPNSTDNSNLLSSNGDPSAGKKIDDVTLATMRTLPHVTQATGVVSNFGIKTMRLDGQPKKTWASISAYDPTNDVFDISIAYGRKLTTLDEGKIVIGDRFAQDMGYGGKQAKLIGQRVMLNYAMGPGTGPDWGASPDKPPLNADKSWYENNNQGVDIPAEIVGVTASSAIDDGQSYITLGWAKRLMTRVSWQQTGGYDKGQQNNGNNNGFGGQYTLPPPTWQLVKDDGFSQQGYGAIILKVDDTANLGNVAAAIKQQGYGANTAQTMLDQINQIMMIISIIFGAIGGISLFVATIGIINTMIMAAYERIREIGVMRACGATRSTIRRLFTIEAGLLGFWGGLLGLGLSYGLAKLAVQIVSTHSDSLSKLPPGALMAVTHFPLWLVGWVIAFTSLLGMLAGVFPAIHASRLNPVDALRYE